MTSLPAYTIRGTVAENRGTVVMRATRVSDGREVVLKTARHAPTREQVARLTREFEMAHRLRSVPGVIETLELAGADGTCAMVMEDIGGESLDLVAEEAPLSLRECLEVSVQVSGTLGHLHDLHVMHKDVNPSNLVWNRKTGVARVIDFGLATELRRETPSVLNANVLQGTLAFMSPEQTGRMNRSVDYRTDLYSLGATLYRLLTGRPPFPPADAGTSREPRPADALEMVHAHLARMPIAPHEVSPGVPEVLSRIVLKLMAKRAEDRYQSAFALRDDLKACLDRLTPEGTIEPFPIAVADVSSRFQVPQRLYGRDAEIAALLAAFERTRRGSREIVLVAGYSGIGKSALVNEVQKPIVRARGAFLSGKFDQLSRNIPYASLIQAFQGLVRQLLAEPAERLARWREKLLAALGPNAQVIVEVLPEVELVVGRQPPLPDLPAAEAQNRFNFAVESFVRTFAAADHPLVLFLDDLQWADAPSLRLLEALVTDAKTSHLLLIGAYRDNEVDASHPLMLSLGEMRRRRASMETVTLAPLGLEDCVDLVADTVRAERERARPLAEACARKTAGNPFFLNQLLRALYDGGSIDFDSQARRWTWSMDAVERSDLTENVVEMMARKIHGLSEGTRRALTTAACIGGTFDLQTLAVARGDTPRRVAADLWSALSEELVLPLGEAYADFGGESGELGQASTARGRTDDSGAAADHVVYRFLHDRVQQAAYSLLAASEKEELHLRIGRSLLRNAGSERGASLFAIANHLNLGRALLATQAERDEVASLNLESARKASASAAHGSAIAYLAQGIELLGPDPWDRTYALALALHVGAADACQLLGDFEGMERYADIALARARTVLEKVKVYETRYQAFVSQRRYADAIAAAREVLALLGERFPEKPGKAAILLDLARTKMALSGRSTESLAGLPPMTDPVRLAAMRILAKASTAAYIASPELFPFIVFRMIRLSVRHGNTAASAYGYAVYGIILCGVVGDVDGAYEFGKLSLAVLSSLPNAAEYEARTRFISAAHLGHWKDPVHQRLDSFRDIYQRALDTGDLEFAAWALMIRSMHHFFVGTPLPEACREAGTYAEALVELKHDSGTQYINAVRQAELCLMGEAPTPWRLQGSALDDAVMLPIHHQANDLFGVCNVHLYSLVLCYWFERHAEGLEHAVLADRHLETVAALLQVPVFTFYDSLNRIAIAGTCPPAERARHLRQVGANQRRMEDWAKHAPRNHLHRYQLVEAERARIAGRNDLARQLYRRALASAHENGHPHEEGLAHELLARFWEASEEREMVAASLLRARDLYARWGAAAKVAALDRKLRPLLAASPQPGADLGGTTAGDSVTIQTATASLDLETVLKASQAISGEVVLSRLLEKMIRILIENAGAERGLVLLDRGAPLAHERASADSQLEIVAEGTARGSAAWKASPGPERPDDRPEVTVLPPVPLSEAGSRLAMSVVNFVARSGECVVLDEAVRDPRFSADPYLQERLPKSLLCLPILSRGRLRGVIYLENNLTAGAFTTDRVKTLSMLSGQIVIAIGNAELVEGLERRVEERTRSLRDEKERTEAALLAAERARGEAEEQRRRAEEASRAKSTFLANMSHELRTPLNAVLGFAQLMARRRGRDAEDLEQLEIIGRAGEHLLGLINDVLSLSKIEAGHISLARAPFPLVPLLEGLADMLRVKAEAKGVTLAFEAAGDLPTHVVGDQSRLRQVLLNLLGNAVKFTDRGRVVLRASWRDGRGLFEVSDTGEGMTPAELSRLFRPFVQTATGERSKEGTGLGLAISRDFARLMGGDITVVSEPGKGSTFTAVIDLPAAREGEATRARGDRRRVVGLEAGQPPCRILVVDDVLENRLLLAKLLESVGLEVREAANGEEALERWRDWKPHLIFMDLRMPVMDGRTATERIRAEERASPGGRERVRIVTLSASAFPHERESMGDWGGDDFLAKPFREEALFAKVADLGVRFVHEAGEPEGEAPSGGVLTVARLAAIPRALREPLTAALQGGDDEAARAAAEVLRGHDAPLADALDRALRQYRFDELLSLLERVDT